MLQLDGNKNFWKNGLSVDESRVSILMIFLILFLSTILYSYVDKGVVNNELLEVAKTLIYAVAGINGISYFTNKVGEYDDRV